MDKNLSSLASTASLPDTKTDDRPLAETVPADAARIERIREIAHTFYLERGGVPGDEVADWLKAEQQVNEGLE
jgi:hypothetical protein